MIYSSYGVLARRFLQISTRSSKVARIVPSKKLNPNVGDCLPQWRGETRAEAARREKCDPRGRGRKLEHRVARSHCVGRAVVNFPHFFLIFLYHTCVY